MPTMCREERSERVKGQEGKSVKEKEGRREETIRMVASIDDSCEGRRQKSVARRLQGAQISERKVSNGGSTR